MTATAPADTEVAPTLPSPSPTRPRVRGNGKSARAAAASNTAAGPDDVSIDTTISASAPTVATAPALPDVQLIAIELLYESPLNNRRHYDQAKLRELADSLRSSGQLTPLLVRPTSEIASVDGVAKAPGFEIAAGHRRRRAAAIAGLDHLLVIVRDLSDQEFLEILTIENLQREDVHPLDEATGYAELMKSAGYDVAKIADRIGKSPTYVRDRLKLLALIPPAQQLFLDDTITAGHAVILSRLSRDDQERVVGDAGELSPLFVPENVLAHPRLDLEDARKPVSVRELQSWVDKHVRFDEQHAEVPTFFPETAAVVAAAIEEEEKIVKITHEHFIAPEARAEGERTYSPQSWKRADGQHGSKTCEYSVTGVVAIGPERGEAFKVCVDKKGCTTHWAAEQRASAQRAKANGSSGAASSDSPAQTRAAADRQRQQDEQAREEAKRARWRKAEPALFAALATAVKKMPGGTKGLLGQLLLRDVEQWRAKEATGHVPVGSSAEDLVRHLAFRCLVGDVRAYNAHSNFAKTAKAFGVDVAKVLDSAAPLEAKKRGETTSTTRGRGKGTKAGKKGRRSRA